MRKTKKRWMSRLMICARCYDEGQRSHKVSACLLCGDFCWGELGLCWCKQRSEMTRYHRFQRSLMLVSSVVGLKQTGSCSIRWGRSKTAARQGLVGSVLVGWQMMRRCCRWVMAAG